MRHYWICLFFAVFVSGFGLQVWSDEVLAEPEGVVIEVYTSNLLECKCGRAGYTGIVTIVCEAGLNDDWAVALGWRVTNDNLRCWCYLDTVTVPGLNGGSHDGTGGGYNRRGRELSVIQYYNEVNDEYYYAMHVDPIIINNPCVVHQSQLL